MNKIINVHVQTKGGYMTLITEGKKPEISDSNLLNIVCNHGC